MSINPLDFDPIPVTLNYINGMYWVGMNTSWMVLIDGRGTWMLVEVVGVKAGGSRVGGLDLCVLG